MRPIGRYLYGRKIYETMAIWETPDVIPGLTPGMLDFARIWEAADKIVYSKSLETLSTPKTGLERQFDPRAVRNLTRVPQFGLRKEYLGVIFGSESGWDKPSVFCLQASW